MKTNRAQFEIVTRRDDSITIRDVGHRHGHPSVTNDAEEVVDYLLDQGLLQEGQRLFYFDSEGQLDEILVKDGGFAGFAPGPRDAVTQTRLDIKEGIDP